VIIGEQFIWGHLGKTGGDAFHTLFTAVAPDLVVRADEPTDPTKHRAFTTGDVGPLDGKLLALNLRRLPAWRLSIAQHRSRHGTRTDPTPQPLPSPEELAHSTLPDEHLATFTDGGRLEIGRWLRMEHLRDDCLDFVRLFRPVTDEEVELAQTTVTKRPGNYDHDTRSVIPVELERVLYEQNPVWAAVEQQLYGYLPFERPEAPELQAELTVADPGPVERRRWWQVLGRRAT
jgi:hypothetical protein